MMEVTVLLRVIWSMHSRWALVELTVPPSRRQFKDARSGCRRLYCRSPDARKLVFGCTKSLFWKEQKIFSLQSANDGVQRSRSTNSKQQDTRGGYRYGNQEKGSKEDEANGEAKGKAADAPGSSVPK